MIFRKKISPDCAYCEYGFILNNKENCICKKYGAVKRRTKCLKFKYNPLLRQPEPFPLLKDESE